MFGNRTGLRPESSPWLDRADVLAWLDCSDHGLDSFIASGRLDGVMFRRSWRIREWDVAAVFGLVLPGPRSVEIDWDEALRFERRWAAKAQGPHTLYKLYDAGDHLLYVGITNQGLRRLDQHASDQPWWSQVARVEIEHLPSRAALEVRERDVIAALKPRHNVTGNRSRGAQPTGPVPQATPERRRARLRSPGPEGAAR